jgi:O-acetyl-ADP-ribose deacetylase
MQFNQIEIVTGDITLQRVDAIVNAANTSLLGGGGVDGAIHRAAGPELLEECQQIGGCPTGEARITKGYRLPARWVIHTVGPVWRGGDHDEDLLLSRCYRNSLALAARPEYGIRTIAFPSISTGAYGYPINQAALIAIDEIDRFLAETGWKASVRIICFSQAAYAVYVQAATGMLE